MKTRNHQVVLRIGAALVVTAPLTLSQTTQISLSYNFNGIVHAGEAGQADDPMGFRSISDRALDFSGGVPSDSLVDQYFIAPIPGLLDIVHLGNRNTVNGGLQAFDAMPDNDDIGIQPVWLTSVDQSGPQTSVLGAPLLLQGVSTARILFQISNGGGAFDVTFDFQGGGSFTASVNGPDWFGGVYLGTGFVDSAQPDGNLSLTQASIDLSSQGGSTVTAITFSNPSNPNAGYAILAANIETSITPTAVHQIALDYNFNGVVHAGESGLPDDLDGFRSISDRALDFAAGVPSNALLDPYSLVATPGVLDIVHLGNRNTVDGGNKAFDLMPNGDDIGIQPNWLPVVDQSGPQTTVLGVPILLNSSSSASFLYQISNGGGAFDVTFDFQSGGSVSASLVGADWFGGIYAGTAAVDSALTGNNLSITEGSVNLGASAGETLTQITFSNASNTNAGYAILAANVSGEGLGTSYCVSTVNSSGGPALVSATGSAVAADQDLTLRSQPVPSNVFGIHYYGPNQATVPFGGGFRCVAGSTQRLPLSQASGPVLTAVVNFGSPQAAGIVSGATLNFQGWFRDTGDPSGFNLSNGVSIAFQ